MLLLLLASAVVFVRVTAPRAAVATPPRPPAERPATETSCAYHLQLSSPADSIEISSGDHPPVSALSGNLAVSSGFPVIFLKIRWRDPVTSGELRFAKLTLEPAGKPTITHVFDSRGDIDDLLELSLK